RRESITALPGPQALGSDTGQRGNAADLLKIRCGQVWHGQNLYKRPGILPKNESLYRSFEQAPGRESSDRCRAAIVIQRIFGQQ
ncbi:MAG: hypothetical protein VX853_00315, partial [Pseudomonadota bacterium]|nr:hypothetical protein [Pseudomonadota bacterium]